MVSVLVNGTQLWLMNGPVLLVLCLHLADNNLDVHDARPYD